MTTVKTAELSGPPLDWAVAKCEGPDSVASCYLDDNDELIYRDEAFWSTWEPSTNWAQGGPIIEREHIEWQWLPAPDKAHQYGARKPSLGGLNRTFCMDGPTVLVAAMRCYVASKLGDNVDVPEELK